MATINVVNGQNATGTAFPDIFSVGQDLIAVATLNGNGGIDTLDPQGTRTIGASVTILNIQNLALDVSTLSITGTDLQSFTTIVSDSGATVGNLALIGGGAATTDVTGLTTLNVTGSSFSDTLTFTSASTDIVVNAGSLDDVIETGSGDDTLNGGTDDDTLDGNAGIDTLNGEAGDDTLVVRNGDTANGGNDDDQLNIQGVLTSGVTLNGGTGTDTLDPQGAATVGSAVTLIGIENLALDTSLFTIAAADFAAFDNIVQDGGATVGNMALSAGGSATTNVTELTTLNVTGSGTADTLTFTTSGAVVTDIVVNAGIGVDVIEGGGGDDRLNGGNDGDTLDGNAGADVLNGDNGNDVLIVRNDDDANGGNDNDQFNITGSITAVATLNGGSGVDTMDGQGAVTIGPNVTITGIENLALDGSALTISAADLSPFTTIVADGGAANGVLVLSAGGSATTDVTQLATLTVTGSAAADTLFFTTSGATDTDITVNAGIGSDRIDGGDGDDTLNGGSDVDFLDGNGGADTLNGDAGDDVLTVRNGDDANGGADNDDFIVEGNLTSAASLNGSTGTGDILDPQFAVTIGAAVTITGIEILALDASTLTIGAADLNPFTTIISDGTAPTGNLVISASGSATTNVTELTTLNVTGSSGNDVLTFTTSGAVVTDINVTAGAGADTIATGSGDDRLDGGTGNDNLTLDGGGVDVFVLRPDYGTDTFGFSNGADKVEIGGFGASFNSFTEIFAVATEVGADVRITLPNPTAGSTVGILQNTTLSQLDASDFIFV